DTLYLSLCVYFFFFSSRRRHTRWPRDWSSDVCSSDLRLNEVWRRLMIVEQFLGGDGLSPRLDAGRQTSFSLDEPGRQNGTKHRDDALDRVAAECSGRRHICGGGVERIAFLPRPRRLIERK